MIRRIFTDFPAELNIPSLAVTHHAEGGIPPRDLMRLHAAPQVNEARGHGFNCDVTSSDRCTVFPEWID